MPSWGDILREFRDSQHQRGPQLGADSDAIRRKYIGQLRDLTGHAVIVYGSGWLKSSGESHPDFSVQGADVHALMEMCKDVEDRKLDLILHSPGGEVGAAEQIVRYLRTQFDYIRAIVPLQAKSAATMIALGCDEIVMGHHSELGPIDPQIVVRGPEGVRSVPAHAILRDFQRAKRELAQDASAINAWLPVLRARLQRQVLVQAKPRDEEQASRQPRENRQQRRAHARRQRKRR